MPELTNTLVDAAGVPRVGIPVVIDLVGVWSLDGEQETIPASVWSGVTDNDGMWSADLPAQSTYEGSTYYVVREGDPAKGSSKHFCTVADVPDPQRLRDQLTTPVDLLTVSGLTLDGLIDVTTSGAIPGKVLGFDGAIWKPTTPSGGGGGSGSVNSVTEGDSTITIGGTTADPTVAVNAIPESKVTSLVTDLAGKAASVHTHTESQVTGLVSDLAAKAASVHSHVESDVTGLVSDLSSVATSLAGKSNTGHSHVESDVISLVTDLAAKAADSTVVHNTGTETVGGVKTFSSAPVVPVPGAAGNPVRNDDTRLSDARTPTAHSHPESQVTNLIADLAAKADLVSGKVPTAELASGSASGTTFLRGDQTWVAPAGGGTVTSVTNADSTITVAGTASDPTVAVNAIAESKVTNLVSDLAAKAMSLTATAVKTSNYPAVAGDLVRGDPSGGVFTVTLPASSVGTLIGIKKTDSSANALNFAVTGGDTIDGASSGSLTLSGQCRIFLGVTGGWTVPYGLNSLSSLDARYVPKSLVDAKGDLLTATADDTPARRSVGSDNQLLLPDAAQSTGLKWADGPPAVVATGVTGTTTGRFVGVTASGPPTSGTFAVGDFVVDQNGNMWVCVTAGTQGLWTTPSDLKNSLASGEETFIRDFSSSTTVPTTSQTLRLTYFTSRKSETTTQVKTATGSSAAAATPTLCKMGLYSIAANGDGTLAAATANDTSLFAATSTGYTRSWVSSYAKLAGQRYAFAVLVVSGVATPTLVGTVPAAGMSSETSASLRTSGFVGSQTDLPSSFTGASVTTSPHRHYATILP